MAEKRRSARARGAESTRRTEPGREVATVRCPYCHAEVPQDALAARCGKCRTVHHATCFDEKRGCSVTGCGGKAAQVVKGWREALGECRMCRAKVYLDENVAVCESCGSIHHPSCLEARDGCAGCGAGEGMIVRASEMPRGHGPLAFFALFGTLVAGGVSVFALARLGAPALVLAVLGALALIAGAALAARVESRRRRRLLRSVEKVEPAKPDKAES